MKKYIKRIKMELAQYGYDAPSLKYRLINNHATPKVLANSIPKSGTNLLLRALYSFPSMRRKLHKTVNDRSSNILDVFKSLKPGEICSAHLKYSSEIYESLITNDIKNIIIVRDPRDIAVSNCMYITYKDPRHRLSAYFINELTSDEQRIMASIEGIPAYKLKDGVESLSIAKHYEGYLKWSANKNCLVICFEDLIGEKGGGAKESQITCLKNIVEHVGLDTNENEIIQVFEKTFNPASRAFVKGKIRSRKEYFNFKYIEMIKSSMNSCLIDLGYTNAVIW